MYFAVRSVRLSPSTRMQTRLPERSMTRASENVSASIFLHQVHQLVEKSTIVGIRWFSERFMPSSKSCQVMAGAAEAGAGRASGMAESSRARATIGAARMFLPTY